MDNIDITININYVCFICIINRCDIHFSFEVILIHINFITCTENDF